MGSEMCIRDRPNLKKVSEMIAFRGFTWTVTDPSAFSINDDMTKPFYDRTALICDVTTCVNKRTSFDSDAKSKPHSYIFFM